MFPKHVILQLHWVVVLYCCGLCHCALNKTFDISAEDMRQIQHWAKLKDELSFVSNLSVLSLVFDGVQYKDLYLSVILLVQQAMFKTEKYF